MEILVYKQSSVILILHFKTSNFEMHQHFITQLKLPLSDGIIFFSITNITAECTVQMWTDVLQQMLS